MELTKKELEQVLDQKITNLPTKDDLQKAIVASEKKIITRIDEAQEELARMTKSGFDDVLERLDVKERVQKLEKEMISIQTALHLS